MFVRPNRNNFEINKSCTLSYDLWKFLKLIVASIPLDWKTLNFCDFETFFKMPILGSKNDPTGLKMVPKDSPWATASDKLKNKTWIFGRHTILVSIHLWRKCQNIMPESMIGHHSNIFFEVRETWVRLWIKKYKNSRMMEGSTYFSCIFPCFNW